MTTMLMGRSTAVRARETQALLSGVHVRASATGLGFYRDGLLNSETSATGNLVQLGRKGLQTVTVEVTGPARGVNAGCFGFRYDTASDLAAVVAGMGMFAPQTFVSGRRAGGKDSFTFSAPDGTTVELSAPAAQTGAGPLDPDEYVAAHLTADGRHALAHPEQRCLLPVPQLTAATLRVRELRVTARFYIEMFGFVVIAETQGLVVLECAAGQRLVLAAAKRGVTGLAGLSLLVPTPMDLDAAVERLVLAGYRVETTGTQVHCTDPDGTRLTISNED